jgi:hypothetical protein
MKCKNKNRHVSVHVGDDCKSEREGVWCMKVGKKEKKKYNLNKIKKQEIGTNLYMLLWNICFVCFGKDFFRFVLVLV